MTSSFRNQDGPKGKEVDSPETQSKDSWRLYFGRTPGGIPAVRVVKKVDESPRETEHGNEGTAE